MIRTLVLGMAALVFATTLAWGARGEEGGTVSGSPQAAWAGGWKVGIEPGTPSEDSGEDSGKTFVMVAYGALWVILFLFVLRLLGLAAQNRRELAELRELLNRHLQKEPGARE